MIPATDGPGLHHPRDLDSWQAWQDSRNRLRRIRELTRRTVPVPLYYAPPKDQRGPTLLVALDSLSPTSRASLLTPFLHGPWADRTGFVTLAADVPGVTGLRPIDTLASPDVATPTVAVALGHFLPAGAAAFDLVNRRGGQFVTVQHGLLTPHAPPLAPDTVLLAWSASDAAYWAAARPDVQTKVVGSTLLWSASQNAVDAAPVDDRPPLLYLGQLHGAELPLRRLASSARQFCQMTGATYRPHPSEVDKISRLIHQRWQRSGISIDRSGTPLREVPTPVISVFSTGVLEAAARGVPAWVHFDNPPTWLSDFWTRYHMRPWGGDPTPAPPVPDLNPAHAIAHEVRAMMES